MHPPNHPHWENAKEEADPHMIIPWTDADFFSFFDFHIKSPCFSTNKCDISKPLHTHTPDSHMFYLDFDSFMNMDIADVSLSVNSWLILCKVWKNNFRSFSFVRTAHALLLHLEPVVCDSVHLASNFCTISIQGISLIMSSMSKIEL